MHSPQQQYLTHCSELSSPHLPGVTLCGYLCKKSSIWSPKLTNSPLIKKGKKKEASRSKRELLRAQLPTQRPRGVRRQSRIKDRDWCWMQKWSIFSSSINTMKVTAENFGNHSLQPTILWLNCLLPAPYRKKAAALNVHTNLTLHWWALLLPYTHYSNSCLIYV